MLVAEDGPSFVKMLVLAPAFVLGDAGERAFVGEMILALGDADIGAATLLLGFRFLVDATAVRARATCVSS